MVEPARAAVANLLAASMERSRWGAAHLGALATLVLLSFEFYRRVLPRFFHSAPRLKARGKHLDMLLGIDYAFMLFNELLTIVMTFNFFQYAVQSPNVLWRLEQLSLMNTVVAVSAIFLVYDFVYTLFHRALHHRSVYAYIHKHHHRQVVPTRGNTDAINVHPIEFALGEYNHLLAFYLVSRWVVPCHVLAGLAFLVAGGALASLNHTRLDLRLCLPGLPVPLFDVSAHDTHHCVPMSNYGQYTMLWDWLMGSYKPYEVGEKVV